MRSFSVRPIWFVLAALLVAACAAPADSPYVASSAAKEKGQGDKLLVRLYDARTGVHLELANETHPDLADAYSELRQEASLKLAPDELMGELLSDLDHAGFGKLAGDGRPPSSAPARGWVEVRRGGQSRTFVVPEGSGASQEQTLAFANMKFLIHDYYSHLGGLQFIDNPQGAAIFQGKGP